MSGEIDVYHIEKLMLIAHITVEADSHGRRSTVGGPGFNSTDLQLPKLNVQLAAIGISILP